MTSSPTLRPAPPQPVATAAKLLYLMAGLSVIGIILAVTVGLPAIRAAASTSGAALSPSAVSAATTLGVVLAVVFGLVGAALYVLVGVFVARGKNWARIVAFILAGLTVLYGGAGLRNIGVTSIASILQLVAAAGVIWFLTRPESSAYFAAARPGVSEPGYPSFPGQS